MAVPAVLMQQLLELDEPLRAKIGYALLESGDKECYVAAQELLATIDEDMTDDERAELDAAIELSLKEFAEGKGIPFDEAMATLRGAQALKAATR